MWLIFAGSKNVGPSRAARATETCIVHLPTVPDGPTAFYMGFVSCHSAGSPWLSLCALPAIGSTMRPLIGPSGVCSQLFCQCHATSVQV